MSYAPSFYADQAGKSRNGQDQQQHQEQQAFEAAIPNLSTPIADDVLSPSQIQEAIRLYRNVLSNSAPSSPVRPTRQQQQNQEVHSNYYGGGSTGIPQSYLNQKPRSQTPKFEEEQQHAEQLMQKLENLQIQEPKIAQNIYGQDESGYCFNRQQKSNQDLGGQPDEDQEIFVEESGQKTPTAYHQQVYTQAPPAQNFPAQNYTPSKNLGPSEYIGMSNDNRFIYDARQSAPPSYGAPIYSAPPPKLAQEFSSAMTTTEDLTQKPGESPMTQSRFRGLIRNASTPTRQSNTQIVVERVYQQQQQQDSPNSGAFAPIHQPTESEYQLPVLNDLASCIENY
ncbi:unnamed protein product [Caenorhabditis angaria]|uniref:Uncharacterized protein n=1 Tax=Caenorhabditis angaria TaxID=860376 RepID=A0A9P1IFL8_9PELO|nr:unnamed protein product [Caenorhabditis angaria]